MRDQTRSQPGISWAGVSFAAAIGASFGTYYLLLLVLYATGAMSLVMEGWMLLVLGAVAGSLVLQQRHPVPRWPIWLFFFPAVLVGLLISLYLVAAITGQLIV